MTTKRCCWTCNHYRHIDFEDGKDIAFCHFRMPQWATEHRPRVERDFGTECPCWQKAAHLCGDDRECVFCGGKLL